MIQDPLFYAAAIPAVLIVGISKSGMGGGSLGILSIPILSLVASPSVGAAIMLPLLIAMDIMGLIAFRGKGDMRNLRILIPAALVGITVGALTFRFTSDAMLRGLIGILSISFVVQRLMGLGSAAVPTQPSIVKGSLWGAMSGFTSFIANAGGPPFVIYLAPQQLDKLVFVGTSVIFFSVINAVKVVPFIALGLFDTRNLTTSLALLPLAPIGYWLGLKMLMKVNQVRFYQITVAALFLAGCKLLWDAAGAYLG
ncbi:putative permease [Herbaspirillum sp. CF444]|uniref:sulfite exporter TauE/SafE family protein n=1 Tax=Herbaspirillum sp. CF444 TaxID=1144319 RepID=UPI00027268F2|nr:sulfite exporter TauE/SafE family protein [Herbaspirillum sp. CF444]EJL87830.1 putative permease [Herbaspirillum sp. CF444]